MTVEAERSIVYSSTEHLGWFECNHLSCIDHQRFPCLGIPALALFLNLDRPFSETGDHDVISLVEILLDDFKNAFDDTDALFFGDAEFLVNGIDDINLGQAHGCSPFILPSAYSFSPLMPPPASLPNLFPKRSGASFRRNQWPP